MKLRQLALASALCTVAATGARAATVAVDVGHFLAKPGATSAYGVPEFEYNHSLAAVIAARLAAGENDDTYVLVLHIDLLIEKHHASGHLIFLLSSTSLNRLAEHIQRYLNGIS